VLILCDVPPPVPPPITPLGCGRFICYSGGPPPPSPTSGGGGGGASSTPPPPQVQTMPLGQIVQQRFGTQANACEQENLNAVNNQFGIGLTTFDVDGMFQYSEGAPSGQGTLNLDISVPLQYQSYRISPGRYPANWWTYVIGYGPTLHVQAGPGGMDSPQTLVSQTANLRNTSTRPFLTIRLAF
jgi:hypothetical protein